MAAKSYLFTSQLLKLIFQAIGIANIADNAASAPLTTLYIALHTATPGQGGGQSNNEIAYGGYARQAVARTTGGWWLNGTGPYTITPANPITFPNCASGGGTATFWSIGTAVSGANEVLYFGPISPSIVVSAGVTPQLTTLSTVTES